MNDRWKQFLKRSQERVVRGEPLEQVIANLHTEGLAILEAIKMVRSLYGLSLKEAERLVLTHPAWVNEANTVISLEDIVETVENDPAYFAWLEWYTTGIYGLGMMRISKGPAWEHEIEVRLREVVEASEEMQQHLANELACQPDETLDAFLGIVGEYSRYEKAVVELAMRTIRSIGFPANAAAIRWLIFLAVDVDAPGRDEAINALWEMDVNAVVPYLLAAFMKDGDQRQGWSRTVNGVCNIIMEHQAWATVCGLAVTSLLSQYAQQGKEQPDPAILLAVLESIIPACTYAIPALYHLALQERDSAIGKEAQRLLLSFDAETLRPYRYHLQWLSEGET